MTTPRAIIIAVGLALGGTTLAMFALPSAEAGSFKDPVVCEWLRLMADHDRQSIATALAEGKSTEFPTMMLLGDLVNATAACKTDLYKPEISKLMNDLVESRHGG